MELSAEQKQNLKLFGIMFAATVAAIWVMQRIG
jgi:hypothetical protein